jgi:hypothetical protein
MQCGVIPAQGLAAQIRTRQLREATTVKVTDEQHVLQIVGRGYQALPASRLPHLKRPTNNA